MRLLRPNIPVGVSVWRDSANGSIVEAAYVWDTGFVWCGLESRIAPADIAVLGSRPGREQFWVYDDEKGDLVGGGASGFLRSLVSTALAEPARLKLFFSPSGQSETLLSGEPIDLDRPDDLGIVPRWDSPEIFPAGEPGRVARYRRHQSWYRENVLKVGAGPFARYRALGSYLDPAAVEIDPSVNFLTAEAEEHAANRAIVVKGEGGALDPVRLRHNMLSSMPLCFNLFGSMRGEPAFLTLFRMLFDPRATAIRDVICEYAPQPASGFLGDRTAFDAIVFYETDDGPRFMGIETKYTEPFSATEYDSVRYHEVTASCGWFADPITGDGVLKGRKSNQLWRNLMLAAALEDYGSSGVGAVAVVALGDDPGAAAAVDVLRGVLTDQSRLLWVPLEAVVTAADSVSELEAWSSAFRLRYLPSHL